MSRRRIRKLYAHACAAWRQGVLAGEGRGEQGKFSDKGLPEAPTEPGFDYAVWTAMRLGFEHAERVWELTPEAWAVVLAEAQRP